MYNWYWTVHVCPGVKCIIGIGQYMYARGEVYNWYWTVHVCPGVKCIIGIGQYMYARG